MLAGALVYRQYLYCSSIKILDYEAQLSPYRNINLFSGHRISTAQWTSLLLGCLRPWDIRDSFFLPICMAQAECDTERLGIRFLRGLTIWYLMKDSI